MGKNYKQPNTLNMAHEFHDMFNQDILTNPQIPNKKRCELRINLIEEEFSELKNAISNNDLVEVADALWDLEYMIMGTILEFGLWDKFYDIMNAIHNSNMTKLCNNEQEAIDSIKYYENKVWWKYNHIKKWNGKRAIVREDGKWIKSIYYKPVDIKSIIW